MKLALAMAATLLWQSPLRDWERGQRRLSEEAARIEGEVHERARPPIAIVYRTGRPLAWVSVYQSASMFPFCDIDTEAIIFALDDRRVWVCKEGKRAAMLGEYAVVVTRGPTSVVEWKAGVETLTTLR